MTSTTPPAQLEAKLVVLGSQNVGKTCLVNRHAKNAFIPPEKAQSTVGANFTISTLHDPESNSTIRLQIWDTAGQERFRSISRLYYRGAQAAILCYDVTNKRSFEDMASWLKELRENCGDGIIVQVVGTKADVGLEPEKKEVPFESCLNYVAQQLGGGALTPGLAGVVTLGVQMMSPVSNRSSGYWGQEWDCAHEVSAKDGEGIEEVFRVITRKLVEQHHRKLEHLKLSENSPPRGRTPGLDGGECYFDLPKGGATGSFRLGYGDKRRSWLGIPTPGGLTNYSDDSEIGFEAAKGMRRGKCC
jgi:small GTP-binding protein